MDEAGTGRPKGAAVRWKARGRSCRCGLLVESQRGLSSGSSSGPRPRSEAEALRASGDISVRVAEDGVEAWTPPKTARRGGPRRYSDLATKTALTLRLPFHLPLRQTEGFIASISRSTELDLPAPDHTTLSRRSRTVGSELRARHEEARRREARLTCLLLNRLQDLGRPESRPVS